VWYYLRDCSPQIGAVNYALGSYQVCLLRSDIKQIETASKSDRPKVMNDLNEFFPVATEGLDEDSKKEVILQQIKERSRRYMVNAIVIVLFGLMAGGLTALSVAKGTNQEKTDPCKDLPFDQRPISCLDNGKEGK